jgi:hypothetical protein
MDYSSWKALNTNKEINQSVNHISDIIQTSNKNKNKWGIQVGAYKDKSLADSAVKETNNTLKDLGNFNYAVEQFYNKDHETIYRSRIYGMEKGEIAEIACSIIRAENRNCIVIKPETLVSSLN